MTAKRPATKAPAQTSPAAAMAPLSLDDIEDRRAKNKIAQLRTKLSKAADDPDVAARMVRHIQTLLREGQ